MTSFQNKITQSIQASLLKYDEDKKKFIEFCNGQRCPLCQSQLDGNIGRTQANLYCACNNEEYKVVFIPEKIEPIAESITYWYDTYMYVISYTWVITSTDSFSKTIIERFNIDANPKFRAQTRKVVFDYPKERLLFFRTRMDEAQFLKKLKTYQIFG